MTEAFKTFNQWSSEGGKIKKGSKSIKHDDKGTPLFHISQVSFREKPLYHSTSYWDSATDENCSGGPMYGIYGNCD